MSLVAPLARLTSHAATVSYIYFPDSCATVFSDLVIPKNLPEALYNILQLVDFFFFFYGE